MGIIFLTDLNSLLIVLCMLPSDLQRINWLNCYQFQTLSEFIGAPYISSYKIDQGKSQKINSGQSSEDIRKLEKQKKNELDSLIDSARNAPPEITADIIFQLVEAGIIPDNNKKKMLLEELFISSFSTQYKVKRHDSIDKPDTRNGMLSYAYSLNLDRLSIQCRSVRAMIALDKRKARELFQQIIVPELDPLTCEDTLVYDISNYYETLKEILSNAPTEDDRKQQEQVALISQAIVNITSPLQFSPTIKVLSSLDLPRADLSYLTQIFSKKMSNLSSDARSFIWAMRSLGTEVKNFAGHCKNKDVAFDIILSGYRSFLINNMTSNWCDEYQDKSKIIDLVKKEADSFNSTLDSLFGTGNIHQLSLQVKEVMPKGVDKPPKIYEFLETLDGKRLLRGVQGLNYGPGARKLSLSDKEKLEWQNQLTNYYTDFKSWARSEGMSELDYFHHKCTIFGVLLEIIPPSNNQYEAVLRDYIGYLSHNRLRQESVIEWLWQARALILRMRLTNQSPEIILNAFSDSGDNILRLIADTKLFIAKYKGSRN